VAEVTEPSLALQTAIRARLINTPAVMALVDADRIIDGPARPETFPTIIIGEGQTVLEGHAGIVRNVRVYTDLHIWTVEAGLAVAKAIGGAVWQALGRALDVPGFTLTDGIHVTGLRSFRDPSGKHGHAVLTVEAIMGWTV